MIQDLGAQQADGLSQAEPDVSALRASIPSAIKRVLMWFGPFAITLFGMALMMVAVAVEDRGDVNIPLALVGGMAIPSALENYAERARAAEMKVWAKRLADMLSGDTTTTFVVQHEFKSIRPELDELIAREVAQAIEARRAETGTGSVHESAVPTGDAPKGGAGQ